MQEEEIHNSPDMFKGAQKYSTPRLPWVVDFPRCYHANIDWYIRMPEDPPLVDPKVEISP